MNTFYPENRKQWREWLDRNHAIESSVWLIYYKKNSGKSSITYSDTSGQRQWLLYQSQHCQFKSLRSTEPSRSVERNVAIV